MKRAWIPLAAFIFVAAVASAQSAKYKDWPKSPEAYFLTPAERTEWAQVKSDEDAEKFIATYYARRGGDKFKAEIARRIAAADEQFKLRRQRGAESSRGRLLIVLGGPTRVTTTRGAGGPDTPGNPSVAQSDPRTDTAFGGTATTPVVVQNWIYEKDKFDSSWGIGDLNLRVSVDTQRGTDEIQNAAAANRAIAVIAEKSVVAPNAGAAASSATVAAAAPTPAGASSAAAPAAATPSAPSVNAVKPSIPASATGPASTATAATTATTAAPAAPASAAIPAATRAALDAVLKENHNAAGAFWGGPFRSVAGDAFYSLELSVPAEKAPAATAKFAGVVTSEAGQEAATFWDDAPLTEVKTGQRNDKVYERSIVLPPGTYRAAFGLFPADGSAALATASVRFELKPKSAEFEVSPLILASTLTPLTKRPAPTDPFVFGMDKPIRVDPKGSRIFAREESLWYFYTVTNPAMPEAAAAPAPAPAATPAPGAPAPPPAAVPSAAKPRIMTRIGVLREGQPAFAPFTGPAELQLLSPGYYATGSEIPLSSFEPGFYTFTLNVRDIGAPRESAAFKGFDRREEFVVLKPDGTMPEKSAAKPAPTAAAKPKPKKS
ncbi:MAG: GWxTD domain-containing protein [Acidobacteriota bacterium]